MSSRGVPPDPALTELVRRDVFEDTTDDEAAHLRCDAMCEQWLVELQRVAQALQAQLEAHRDGTRPRDEDWRRKAAFLSHRYNETIVEARAVCVDFRARMRAGGIGELQGEIARLRGAIRDHQAALGDADAEAEEWDLVLWAHVQLTPAN